MKIPRLKFHENPFSSSRADTSGLASRTDGAQT
jgi:hypothetical protein